MPGTEVRLSGPFFDSEQRDRIMHRMTTDSRHAVADFAFDVWSTLMEHNFQHPTGVYQSFAHVVDDDPDTLVNDGWGVTNDLPYGPWLEGVGSRNSPVTRFPGYHSLRDAAAATERNVLDIVQPHVDAGMEAMNGE
jgi:hypothetical protein